MAQACLHNNPLIIFPVAPREILVHGRRNSQNRPPTIHESSLSSLNYEIGRFRPPTFVTVPFSSLMCSSTLASSSSIPDLSVYLVLISLTSSSSSHVNHVASKSLSSSSSSFSPSLLLLSLILYMLVRILCILTVHRTY